MSSSKQSAGLLMFRKRLNEGVEVLLAHPGGPYFARKDHGAWGVPKGLLEPNEAPIQAARREFEEETGYEPPQTGLVELGEVRYKSGKRVWVWAFEGTCEPELLASNMFEIEWPPRSGQRKSFPELDRFDFFDLATAEEKIHVAQKPLLSRLLHAIAVRG